jgi:hypothetical protein
MNRKAMGGEKINKDKKHYKITEEPAPVKQQRMSTLASTEDVRNCSRIDQQ